MFEIRFVFFEPIGQIYLSVREISDQNKEYLVGIFKDVFGYESSGLFNTGGFIEWRQSEDWEFDNLTDIIINLNFVEDHIDYYQKQWTKKYSKINDFRKEMYMIKEDLNTNYFTEFSDLY